MAEADTAVVQSVQNSSGDVAAALPTATIQFKNSRKVRSRKYKRQKQPLRHVYGRKERLQRKLYN